MKKTIAVLLLLASSPASADWKDKVSGALLFASGVVAGFVVHEAGHAIAASIYREDMEWAGRGFDVEWWCKGECKHLDNIALAGNLTTAIVGETLLHLPYSGPFVDGIQAFNTVNPIHYAINDSMTPGGYWDYRYVDDRIQVALAIHAATIGYRQFSERLWNVSFSRNRINLSVKF